MNTTTMPTVSAAAGKVTITTTNQRTVLSVPEARDLAYAVHRAVWAAMEGRTR